MRFGMEVTAEHQIASGMPFLKYQYIGFVRKRKHLCNKKRRTLLKKTKDLINEIVAMGFAKEEALKQIDASLDELLGFEKRKELIDEEISEEIYENILFGFQC